jgi:hypothetical protein
MADQQEPTAEQKYGPKLPKQIQDQVDAVNAALTPEEEPPAEEPEGDEPEFEEGDEQPEGEPQELQADSWEQRARSAAGRLEQALSSNQQLARRVSELEDQMAGKKLKAEPTEPPPYQKQPLIKPDEMNDYGEEFFDVVGRKAREEISPELYQFGERLKRLEGRQDVVTQVIDKTQKHSVYDMLYDEVPQWKQINHHPAFKQWLGQLDPYSGRPLAEMLSEAMTRHDAPRVVNFFRGFAEAAGLPLNSSNDGDAAPPPANGSGSGRPSLEDFAAPGRARSAPQNLPPEKPVYTVAQIREISEAKRRGLWRGREAELEAIERDIFAAQHEGRIQ